MGELTYKVRGREVTAVQLLADKELAEVGKKPKKPKAIDALKRVESRADARESLGFIVTGFSPERLQKAEAEHKAAREAAIETNRKLRGSDPMRVKIPPEWDQQHYMATHKPSKAHSKPYWDVQAADRCADLMRAAGWLSVTVIEDLRG